MQKLQLLPYLKLFLIDTKVVTQDAIRTMESEQFNFKDQTLKTKVQTKTLGQDELKYKKPEQRDFRPETIKSKVQTKAVKEEDIKVGRKVIVHDLLVSTQTVIISLFVEVYSIASDAR